jgi:predicted DNA-binding WGR domain protein
MTKIKEFFVEGRQVEVAIDETESMTCTENGHNKFWIGTKGHETSTNAPVVILQWGKIGSAGHTELKRFKNIFRRDNYFEDRVWDKRAKNYVVNYDHRPTPKPVASPKETLGAITTSAFAWDLF